MSVSEIQIAKLALQHIGDRYDITSLDEPTTEAEQVKLVFDNVRDALLAEFPWKFAKQYVQPAQLVGTPPALWTYMYAYPPTAMRVLKIVDPRGRGLFTPIPFDVLRNFDGAKVLVTDMETPQFEFVAKVTDPTQFSPHFVLALSWRIAEMVAMPLTGSAEVRDRMQRDADKWVVVAMEQDGNEGVEPPQTRDPDWILARGGTEAARY